MAGVNSNVNWLKFLETFQKELLYVEELDTIELAQQRDRSFRYFTRTLNKFVNNPRYALHTKTLQQLELKRVGRKLYFIHHTDSIAIHSTKFAKTNIRLQKLGYPRIQNA